MYLKVLGRSSDQGGAFLPQVSAFGAVLSAGLDYGLTTLAGRADALWQPRSDAQMQWASSDASAPAGRRQHPRAGR